ncbi:hypothetical protein PoB_004510100 [Plakobranchus ocellatus]|uniref:Uncharacterized protein n=1 Tax=Plakobranchus ocellatus TaxID=259542 RepID=A0AAV4B5D5_9GAST|nr:hypothetical protein PoB_004510100 [Plakobranchus ocellatus]
MSPRNILAPYWYNYALKGLTNEHEQSIVHPLSILHNQQTCMLNHLGTSPFLAQNERGWRGLGALCPYLSNKGLRRRFLLGQSSGKGSHIRNLCDQRPSCVAKHVERLLSSQDNNTLHGALSRSHLQAFSYTTVLVSRSTHWTQNANEPLDSNEKFYTACTEYSYCYTVVVNAVLCWVAVRKLFVSLIYAWTLVVCMIYCYVVLLRHTRDVGGTVVTESALKSAEILLSRSRAPPPTPWPDGGPESLRSSHCVLALY